MPPGLFEWPYTGNRLKSRTGLKLEANLRCFILLSSLKLSNLKSKPSDFRCFLKKVRVYQKSLSGAGSTPNPNISAPFFVWKDWWKVVYEDGIYPARITKQINRFGWFSDFNAPFNDPFNSLIQCPGYWTSPWNEKHISIIPVMISNDPTIFFFFT